MIEIDPPPPAVNTSPGVTPGVVYSRGGTVVVGSYLKIGDVISSYCGQPIFGKNKIVKLRATNSSTVGSDTVIQLQIRTGLNSFSDIAGASITVPSSGYQATVSMDIALPEDPEVACYIKSGSSLSNPVVILFLYPDYA